MSERCSELYLEVRQSTVLWLVSHQPLRSHTVKSSNCAWAGKQSLPDPREQMCLGTQCITCGPAVPETHFRSSCSNMPQRQGQLMWLHQGQPSMRTDKTKAVSSPHDPQDDTERLATPAFSVGRVSLNTVPNPLSSLTVFTFSGLCSQR